MPRVVSLMGITPFMPDRHPYSAWPNGSGGWIRTTDLRVMSPTSCHCSTRRCDGARTYAPSGYPASTVGAATFHDPVRDGSGWVRRAPRTPLAQGPSAFL